jgi:cyclopropane fatty-acyl-phospholipid synthase-like methyltransferase
MMSERGRWDRLAHDPYYAVINDPRNRDAMSTAADRRAFFESGERDVDATMAAIRATLDPVFAPSHTIDYGCGVGRLSIPLARHSAHVTGVDISAIMLDEGRRNCAERGIGNVEFRLSDDFLATSHPRSADFVHSYIVFQHIPPRTGERIFVRLVEQLTSGGIGALHFTHTRRASMVRRVANWAGRWMLPANMLANLTQGRPMLEPQIPMYRYDLGKLIALLGERGCGAIHALPTNHGEHHGAMLLFRLP